MTIYQAIKERLERYPTARERKNKNKFIAWLLFKKYDVKFQTGVTQDQIESLIVDASSYDRAWRQVLQMEPQLRGKDYGEKDVLEQEKQVDLGYSPTHHEDVKKLNQL